MDRAVNGMQTAQRNTSENALRQGKTMLLVFLGQSTWCNCPTILVRLQLERNWFGRQIIPLTVLCTTCIHDRLQSTCKLIHHQSAKRRMKLLQSTRSLPSL